MLIEKATIKRAIDNKIKEGIADNSDVILKHFIKIFDSINPLSRKIIIETLINRKDINNHIKDSLIEKGKTDLNYYVRECAAG